MIVFHASNCEVITPMLVDSNRLLDFGPGFYTTNNREQAVRFAKSVVMKRGGRPFLNVYEFNYQAARTELLVHDFGSPSEDWLDFVADNRSGRYSGVRFDIVIGPVANDNVYATIGLYLKGFMSRESTIRELRIHSLYNQIVFCRPAAFKFLQHVQTEELQ